ncbi:hypothetical protein M408DRAFT_296976 [Serendipita vermifera MAFF 305830]|uniref:Uncharacterized protein n=1 Tax=Serendipita vermifera MAFF 305830 TaxID=933852 RepID=A0A0C3BFS5_SERVB|nr:hypothetical protein M408DRAFT_296976 [Serendipita vermifera MAFF 305830]
MLCVQLIYRPEMCPSLREIDFGNYVEWDLLFIMLRQRNLGRKDVSRIEKVSVPFVPFELHPALLDLLLGRERQDGPSNMVLSLEETRELICDPSIPGCVECLRNMRPGCGGVARPRQPDDPEEGLLHPFDMKLDNFFGRIPSVDAWMVERRRLVGKWKASFKTFQSRYHRPTLCLFRVPEYILL